MSSHSIYELVDGLGAVPFNGDVFRHISPNRNCTSGEGVRQAGGRWNPPDSFPVLYTGLTELAVAEELYRLAERSSLPSESFLPRTLCILRVDLTAVLDLRQPEALAAVGLSAVRMRSAALEQCQRVGEAAHKLGLEGILAPSATGVGEVLAVFDLNLKNDSSVRELGTREWLEPPSRSS